MSISISLSAHIYMYRKYRRSWIIAWFISSYRLLGNSTSLSTSPSSSSDDTPRLCEECECLQKVWNISVYLLECILPKILPRLDMTLTTIWINTVRLLESGVSWCFQVPYLEIYCIISSIIIFIAFLYYHTLSRQLKKQLPILTDPCKGVNY